MKKACLITLILLILSYNSISQTNNVSDSLRVSNGLYLGLKVGLPYLIGLDIGYLFTDKLRLRAYLNVSVQTIIIYNSANIGAGYFIGRKGFTAGLRHSRYAHLFSPGLTDEDTGSLTGPEIGWFKTVGKSKNTVISFQLGTAGINFSLGARLF